MMSSCNYTNCTWRRSPSSPSAKAELSNFQASVDMRLEGIEGLLRNLVGRDRGARGAERTDEAPVERGSALVERDDAAT